MTCSTCLISLESIMKKDVMCGVMCCVTFVACYLLFVLVSVSISKSFSLQKKTLISSNKRIWKNNYQKIGNLLGLKFYLIQIFMQVKH